jgi:hypothetical protein
VPTRLGPFDNLNLRQAHSRLTAYAAIQCPALIGDHLP